VWEGEQLLPNCFFEVIVACCQKESSVDPELSSELSLLELYIHNRGWNAIKNKKKNNKQTNKQKTTTF